MRDPAVRAWDAITPADRRQGRRATSCSSRREHGGYRARRGGSCASLRPAAPMIYQGRHRERVRTCRRWRNRPVASFAASDPGDGGRRLGAPLETMLLGDEEDALHRVDANGARLLPGNKAGMPGPIMAQRQREDRQHRRHLRQMTPGAAGPGASQRIEWAMRGLNAQPSRLAGGRYTSTSTPYAGQRVGPRLELWSCSSTRSGGGVISDD